MTEVYSLSIDFPLGLNEYQLKNEISSNNNITVLCTDVGRVGDIVNIIFVSQISNAEKTILNSLITAHIPIPIPINPDLFISNNVIKSNISNNTFTFLGDQPDEIHISKTSQTHYSTIKEAITANNFPNIVFIVHPGTYIEDNPIILPNGCCMYAEGNAENTFIVAQNPNLDILQVGIKCKIEGITFVGSAMGRGIYFDGTQSGGYGRFTAIFECYIVGCNIGVEIDGKNGSGAIDTLYMREILIVSTNYALSKGVYCHSGGQFISSSLNIAGNSYFMIDEGVCCHDLGSKVSMTTSSIWYCNTAIHLDNDGEIEVQLLTCKNNDTALHIDSSGTASKINGDLFNAINSTNYDMNIDSSDSIIDIQSGIVDILKIRNPNNVKINARFQSTQFGSYFNNILGDVVFGTKRVPTKIAIGEGSYDIDSVKIFTNDNLEIGNWIDCTSGAISIDAPPFNIFSGITSGNCIYIGRNDNPVGIKINIITSTTTLTPNTSIVWEYWNGSSWIDFKVSQTTTISPYYINNGNFISNVGKYQIRFGITSMTPLVLKTLNGENKKWVRARLTSDISNIPVSEYCKLHVSASEINNDGFTEYFGNARPIGHLNKWNDSLLQAANGTPGNQDLFISSRLGFNAKTNNFLAGSISRIGMNSYISTDTDIGFPIKIKVSIVGDNDTIGNVELKVRYGSSNLGDSIYLNNGEAPLTSADEKDYSLIINVSSSKKEYRGVFLIDVSDMLHNPSNAEPDLVWLTIERDATLSNINDTYPGNISLINIDTRYVKMFSGGHLLGF